MRVAAIQMISSPQPQENIAVAYRLMKEAKAQGAELVVLPEYWSTMGLRDTDKIACAEIQGAGPLQVFLAEKAKELGLWIIGGTIPLSSSDPRKIFNACLVFNSNGEQIIRYDKIHLFGFTNGAESYQESNTIQEGDAVQCFDSPFGKIGLGICYDLRFPELFRSMGACDLLVLPAAFTYTTGQAHWEILLRARAIENQCFVLASAQGGTHESGRQTWGHSMLIDPWGKIVSQLEQGEGVIVGELDVAQLAQIRTNLPALKHRRIAC
ncbi:carbon-nitrogen hydrolase family protein [Undibacterium fentianense]|uniref:Carbon-nitrogen hydrolase family protein n=1 Tax=Undibacterium fentianense TaxID=2828728 RepID=A0A941DXU9_9BURK|nr:carbon-nitrogen hydrolase family protein [Undibacterium fentianense]MBR7798770.1 carbon-nitrogen hydrolase family protein [Undibacterium fentianense]